MGEKYSEAERGSAPRPLDGLCWELLLTWLKLAPQRSCFSAMQVGKYSVFFHQMCVEKFINWPVLHPFLPALSG